MAKARKWHPEDIKAAVRKSGPTLTELAEINGLPSGACRAALFGPNYRGEMAIATWLGKSPRTLWPNRYNVDGTPKYRVFSKHLDFAAVSPGSHVQKEKAA
ncbi:helix-turn-helix domain-containing protein [Rhodospirillum sp. A1_3_36]|uniref:helix-turn-helix domain-containing protein n=1 Tax=Rhodospirillum sp. A1_3_36 TaxID=3391666 RepID=UPI0039A509EA